MLSTTRMCSLNSILTQDQLDSDELEAQVLATSSASQINLTSWQAVKSTAISDRNYSTLLHTVQSDDGPWPEQIKEFSRFKNDLSTVCSRAELLSLKFSVNMSCNPYTRHIRVPPTWSSGPRSPSGGQPSPRTWPG